LYFPSRQDFFFKANSPARNRVFCKKPGFLRLPPPTNPVFPPSTIRYIRFNIRCQPKAFFLDGEGIVQKTGFLDLS
jgi:hypothetical protein